MKKLVVAVAVVLSLSSCYNARVCVGNVGLNDPVVKVNSVTNHHLLGGLIPVGNNKIKAETYIAGHENYVVKNSWTFLNGFLGTITLGLYTPTTTTFYLPISEMNKK